MPMLRLIIVVMFYSAICYFGPAFAGHWGAETIANDGASDFLEEIIQGSSTEPIRSALTGALAARSYLDDEQSSRALAAAELAAAMVGNPSRILPAPCKKWATLHSKGADTNLIQAAIKAVERISEDSETRDLMQEGGENNLREWQANIADLQARLVAGQK
jgi:hypothetical protein